MEAIAKGTEIVCVHEGFKSLAKEVKREIAAGKVAVFAREGREMEDAVAALALEGFSVVRRAVSPRCLMHYGFNAEEGVPEAVRAAVGVGGAAEMELSKAFASTRNMRTFLFPTDLSALCALKRGAEFSTESQLLSLRSEDCVTLLDASLLQGAKGVKSGMGYLAARITEVLDGAFCRLLEQGESPSEAFALLREVSAGLKGITADNAACKIIAQTLLLERKVREKSLFTAKSATTLAFLAARAENGGDPYEYLFPAAYALLSLYRTYLPRTPFELCVPPDRVRTLSLLREKCKLDASRELLRENALYAPDHMRRRRLAEEYGEDFAEQICEEVFPLTELCRAYRRTDGKVPALSANRLLALLSLTGEEISEYALIKHIKLTGLLEPLIGVA